MHTLLCREFLDRSAYDVDARNLVDRSRINTKNATSRKFEKFVNFCTHIGFSSAMYTYKFPFPITKPYTLQYKSDKFSAVGVFDQKNIEGLHVHRLLNNDNVLDGNRRYKGIYHLEQDLNGGIGGFFLLLDKTMGIDEILDKEYLLVKLCSDTHKNISEDIGIYNRYTTDISLTKREREILRWTADGKTCNEIANILSISKRTVEFHISNAGEKLGTSTKCASVVKALMLGILAE